MTEEITVLAMVPEEDAALFKASLGSKYRFVFTATLAETMDKLRKQPIPVLLHEEGFADVTWKRVLEAVMRLKRAPHLLVIHRFGDDRLWCEVLNLGGHDVINKPYRTEELVRVITNAAKSWLKAA